MFKIIIASIFAIFPLFASAGNDHLTGKSFLLKYDNDQNYSVSFTAEYVTWKGVMGDDVGKSETDQFGVNTITPGLFQVHWIEKNGTDVVLMLDLVRSHVTATKKINNKTTIRTGSVESLCSVKSEEGCIEHLTGSGCTNSSGEYGTCYLLGEDNCSCDTEPSRPNPRAHPSDPCQMWPRPAYCS